MITIELPTLLVWSTIGGACFMLCFKLGGLLYRIAKAYLSCLRRPPSDRISF